MAASVQTDLEAKLTAIARMELPVLRTEWRRLYRKPPPHRLSRDLLIRGIAYKIQEAVHGGLSKSTLRRLKALSEQTATGVTTKLARQAAFKPGTKLLREWNGTTHEVRVLANGYEWRGQTYVSLSRIAKAITGAHWSGPRFGLKSRTHSPVARLKEGKNE
jgi:Protein of unknown function (DUF2924)